MTNHAKGLVLTALGVLLVVPDALFVRLIEAEPLVIVFWRQMVAGLMIAGLFLALQGTKPFRVVAQTGWTGLLYTVLLGGTGVGFVFAIENTSVANVVFIFASIPVFAALFSWLTLGERISARIVLTIVAVVLGLGVITLGSGQSEIAHWSGDAIALAAAAGFAAALTILRRFKDVSMVPAASFAYIGTALLIWPFIAPLEAFGASPWLFVIHGLLIGGATCLYTLGPQYISAAEVALLILLESVLAPLLVWAVIGEAPGNLTLIGGAIVISALLISNLIALRRARLRKAQAAQIEPASTI